jgi:hypothetical protein
MKDSNHLKLWWCMEGRLAGHLEEMIPSVMMTWMMMMMMMMMMMHLEDLEDPEDPVDLEDLEVKMDFLLLMMGGL